MECWWLKHRAEGDANDYVGKSAWRGEIVIYPPKGSTFASQETAIIGNTCLYGATGGKLYASGTAGERWSFVTQVPRGREGWVTTAVSI